MLENTEYSALTTNSLAQHGGDMELTQADPSPAGDPAGGTRPGSDGLMEPLADSGVRRLREWGMNTTGLPRLLDGIDIAGTISRVVQEMPDEAWKVGEVVELPNGWRVLAIS